ncbi:cytochrome p450 [Ophiostoma piceae UAMH 11346]|uniref:Cytochrome p450 n=1 Tax=Ophiostoma piceae (strain UAMH 11346) TaxID=1262450 RepID=S3CAU1_OPHP1|nr:cytochrome p450 [Ophiostoma piceae UAMH 11346]
MAPYSRDGLFEKVGPYVTPLHMGLAIPVLLFAYLFLHAIYDVFFHPLAKFPGPFPAKITRLWITWKCYKEREPYMLQELSKKYGPVFRISPTLLHVSDATKLPAIYSRHAHKPKHYITSSFGATDSLLHMQMHAEHSKYRKAIVGPLGFGGPFGFIDRSEDINDLISGYHAGLL